MSVPAIKYKTIKGGNRKTASLSVSPKNEVSITVPDSLSKDETDRLIQKKSAWIWDKININNSVKFPNKPKEYVNGESFPFAGRNYRLKVAYGDATTKVQNGHIVVSVPKNGNDSASTIADKITEWYKLKALQKLKSRAAFYSKRMPKQPAGIIIKDYKSRWGSCFKNGIIAFNWRIVMTRQRFIDYVVVHELCHLVEDNHSPRFWKLLGTILPDWQERKNWLRVNGGMLDL